MTPHDTPLPAWVSVDQLGSWDDLVQEVKQLWPDVVAKASQAQQFLERDPARVLALFALRIEFEALVAQRNAALTQVVWPRVPTGELVALLRRFVWTLAGIRYLAASMPTVDPASEVVQFYEMLIIRGLLRDVGGDLQDDEDSLDTARFAATSHLTIPWVAHELVERGKGHKPGTAAAILLGLTDVPELRELDTGEDDALKYLQKCVRRRFPKIVWGHGDPSYKGQEDPDLQGQVLLTLDKRWGRLELLERFAAALDGNLDIAPRVVSEDLGRARRKRRQQSTIEVEFHQRVPESEDDREVQDPVDPNAAADDRAIVREAVDRIRRSPDFQRPESRFRAYLEARFQGLSQKDAAEAAGVTDRTARNYDAKLQGLVSPPKGR